MARSRIARLRLAAYLKLASLLLGSARLFLRLGWRSEAILCASLRASNRISRSAMRGWRGRPDPVTGRLPKRSVRG